MIVEHDLKMAFDDGYRAGYEAAQPKWISVEERLPEDDQDVLVHIRGGTIDTAFCTFDNVGHRHWTAYAAMRSDVTHWMPLPDGPKEEV